MQQKPLTSTINQRLIRVNAPKKVVSERREVRHVDIYVDGAISMKNKIGGMGIVFVDRQKDKQILSHSSKYEYDEVTNNQMELIAAISALQLCYTMQEDIFLSKGLSLKNVTLFSDSAYVVNGINEHIYKWDMQNETKTDGTPIKNIGYWKTLIDLHITKLRKRIKFTHIAGHAGHKWNELCDSLAQIQAHGKEVNKR